VAKSVNSRRIIHRTRLVMACIANSNDTKKLTWDEYFQLLTCFKEKHGHTKVPFQYDNDGLAVWVYQQRHHAAKSSPLSLAKCQRLEELGGVLDRKQSEWDRRNAAWVESFLDCVQMREDHGDLKTPNNSAGKVLTWQRIEYLWKWLAEQRRKHLRCLLDDRCSGLLAEIGFTGFGDEDAEEASWDNFFNRLKEYKRQFGNTFVPLDYAPDLELASWVDGLKADPKRLTYRQLRKLKSISFQFDVALTKPSKVKKKSTGFALATAVVTAKKATSVTKANGAVEPNGQLRPSLPSEDTGTSSTLSSRRRCISMPERYRDDPKEEKSPGNSTPTYNAGVPQPSQANKSVVAELTEPKKRAKSQPTGYYYPICCDRIEKESTNEHDGQLEKASLLFFCSCVFARF
jgi:Helicase associated domain